MCIWLEQLDFPNVIYNLISLTESSFENIFHE